MKKNNIKYLIFSGCLMLAVLYFAFDIVYLSNTNVYKELDITGLGKYIEIIISIILAVLAIVSIVKPIKAREKSVDFSFNKNMCMAFIAFTILAIVGFVFVRGAEENVAQTMKSNITNRGEGLLANSVAAEKSDQITNAWYGDLKHLAEDRAESEYISGDKYYWRKSRILTQIEYSSGIERYISMAIYNPNYTYYGYYSIEREEVEYYGVFLKLAIIGVIGVAFFGFNLTSKHNSKDG